MFSILAKGKTIDFKAEYTARGHHLNFHYMSDLEGYFHYRHIDVSTLKELAQRWLPQLAKFEKESKHLAMNDIYESIEELKYYRQHFLRLAI